MKVYELAKKLKRTNKELLQELGLKSHLSVVDDSVVAEFLGEEKKITTGQEAEKVADSPETHDVKKPSGKCPFTPEQVRRSIQIHGVKSVCWEWRGILDG
jgi:hypothetical protein